MPAKMTDDEAQSRRDEILTAAAGVFAEHGYEGATVRDLEAATGLTRGGIFFHFPGKRELYLAVLRKSLLDDPLADEMPFVGKIAISAESVEESLLATYRAILDWHRDHPQAMQFFQQLAVRSGTEPDIAELDRQITESVNRLIAEIVGALQSKRVFNPEVDPRAAAALLHGVMDHLVDNAYSLPPDQAESIARATFNVMAEGLKPREPAPPVDAPRA